MTEFPMSLPDNYQENTGFQPQDITKAYQNQADVMSKVPVEKAKAQAAYDAQQSNYVRGLDTKFQSQMQPTPEFKPSRESTQDLVALFGMIGAIGAMGGGKSYGNALGAMQGMTGMLNGYNQGRKDLFEREKSEFDKNMQAVKAHNDQITQAFDRAVKMAPYNLTAAKNELSLKLAGLDAQVLKSQLETQGIEKTAQLWNQANSSATQKINAQTAQLNALSASQRLQQQTDSPSTRGRPSATDEDIEETAQGIANLSLKAPGLNNRNRDKILARVRQINPGYNEGDFGNIQAAERNWTNPNGAGAKQIQAFNTVYNHLETIDRLGEALKNNDVQATNRLTNLFRTNLGHPEVTNFNAAKQAVASEVVKAITGTAGALADRQEAERILASYNSPEQTKGVVDTLRRLIAGRYEAAERQYTAGTRRSKEDFKRFLPENVNDYFSGSTSSTQPQDDPLGLR